MNILITGGAGFIGSNTADRLHDAGHSVIIFDNLSSGSIDNISHLTTSGSVLFFKGDIRNREDLQAVFSAHRIDACINFAALVSVVDSVNNPLLTEDINVKGLINCLTCCGEHGIKLFIHASSAAVYGDSPVLPKTESMLPEPKSPYAITKLAGEYYTNYFASIYGFKGINCRFFNIFGPRQNPASAYAAALPIFISRALQNETITIYGSGNQTRDFFHVGDLADCIHFLIQNMEAVQNAGSIFNLGYGHHISINSLVKTIISLTESRSAIEYKPSRPGDIEKSYASIDKLESIKWKPKIGFEKGLESTIEWYVKKQ